MVVQLQVVFGLKRIPLRGHSNRLRDPNGDGKLSLWSDIFPAQKRTKRFGQMNRFWSAKLAPVKLRLDLMVTVEAFFSIEELWIFCHSCCFCLASPEHSPLIMNANLN